ncbi:MAG: ABC transporter substrate-binding protein [Thalassotalea sp.]
MTLINPDKQGGKFWDLTTLVAQEAAHDLGINLTVRHSGDWFKNGQIIKSLIKNKSQVDYVIFLPYRESSATSFDSLEKASIPFITLERSMNKAEMEKIALPGEKYHYWLSEIYFDDVQAGKLLSQALLTAHQKKSEQAPSILALSGDYSQLSVNRELGLLQTLTDENAINQTVKTMWEQNNAREKTKGLLKRYPNTNIIWSASDQIALSAIQAANKLNQKITVGGIDWLPSAITAVKQGELDATVGGHFMQAAWALVKIKDHSEGIHIANTDQPLPYYLIDQSNVHQYLWLSDTNNFTLIDFKSYSLFYNKKIKKYNFVIPSLPH